jgi:hypothetical protein
MTEKRFWHEPFVHFFILGVLLFGIDAFLRNQSDTASAGEIVVTAGRIENLGAMFERTWQRPPTAVELKGLIDSYILDEALYREGVALAMDQDDSVVRRRVRQKLDFFVDDLASPDEPEEAELQAWLDAHKDAYAIPAVFTFFQVYLNPERHGDTLDAEAQRLLAELRASTSSIDIGSLGDATLLEPDYVNYRADMVESGFGGGFAAQLEGAPVGEWSGPYESAFGVHLVYLEALTPAGTPELTVVRDEVERDWRYDQREAAVARFHQQALEGYEVTVEWPESTAGGAGDSE